MFGHPELEDMSNEQGLDKQRDFQLVPFEFYTFVGCPLIMELKKS